MLFRQSNWPPTRLPVWCADLAALIRYCAELVEPWDRSHVERLDLVPSQEKFDGWKEAYAVKVRGKIIGFTDSKSPP